MKEEYKINKDFTIPSLMKFRFISRGNSTFMFSTYLYEKIIKGRFILHFNTGIMSYKVYDCSNGKSYLPFYNNVNGDKNKVAIKVIEEFNNVINQLKKENIILED